ncbi:ATP-dependent DNA helicase PIF1-like protein [Tanacetum coccineum]
MVSMREWFAYQIQDRPNQENLYVRGGRLFQQFLVDGYIMIETEHLYFHRVKQSKLRCDTYSNIHKSVAEGNIDPTLLGKPVVLSSSFTGGPRYMEAHNLSATDRPDVMSRVFKIKLDQLMKDLKDLRLFGRTQVCMADEKCMKHFPKKITERSSVDSEGYPVYRRRNNERYMKKSKSQLHNGYVIPYNATLLKRYQCHINVEL